MSSVARKTECYVDTSALIAFLDRSGKPLSLGGSKGRNEGTARGCQYTVRAACETRGFSLPKATVAVQGFGNAGSIAAKLLHEDGARILAVSDSKGGIYNGAGLDPVAVMKYKEETGAVVGFPGCDFIANKDLLELKCDVLVPAALENTITMDSVDRVRAKVVAEAANGPTTPGADKELLAGGVLVIPDILCNAGVVAVSYFEWVQDLYGFFRTEIGEPVSRADHEFGVQGSLRHRRKLSRRHADGRLHTGRLARSRSHARTGDLPVVVGQARGLRRPPRPPLAPSRRGTLMLRKGFRRVRGEEGPALAAAGQKRTRSSPQ